MRGTRRILRRLERERATMALYLPRETAAQPPTITRPDDPAYALLFDGHTSKTTVFSRHCYICRDPEFAQMGLPLCYPCYRCGGHVPADDTRCERGHDQDSEEAARVYEYQERRHA